MLLGSASFAETIDRLDGIWSAVSAICTALAVLVAVWATQKVLQQGQKSQLKDELRAVREAQSSLLASRGLFKAAIHPYWKVDETARETGANGDAEEFDPFDSKEVESESRVHESAYATEAAAWALIGAIQGANALGARLWDTADVDRLVTFIEAYGSKGWFPNYLALVAGGRSSPFALADEVVGAGSPDLEALAATFFADDDHLSGFPQRSPEFARVTDQFVDAGLFRIRDGITAFLAIGDAAAETLKPLRRFRPSGFLDRAGWNALTVPPYAAEQSTNEIVFRARSGQRYTGSTLGEIIEQIWPKNRFREATSNELLARGWRELHLMMMATRHNRGVKRAIERGDLVASPAEVTGLDRVIDGDDVTLPWPHREHPLAAVRGRRLSLSRRNVMLLDPSTERSLLESIGELTPAVTD